MKQRTKKIAKTVAALAFSVCLFAGIASACSQNETAEDLYSDYVVSNVESLSAVVTPEYFDTYAVGERIAINALQGQAEESEKTYAVLQKDYKVYAMLSPGEEQLAYAFTDAGAYNLIYYKVGKNGDKTILKNIAFTVGEGAYIDVIFNARYMVNDTLSVKADCIYGTKKTAPTVSVISPLGNEVAIVDSAIKLPECGKYKITYTAAIEGVSVKRTYYVNVEGKADSYTDYILNVSGITDVEGEISAPEYAVDGTGVRVTGGASSAFRFANVVDVNTLSSTDNAINLLPLGTDGYSTLSKMLVKFIDVYDETNTISYELTWEVQKDPHVYTKILYKTLAKAKKPVGQSGFYENTIYGLGAGGVHFNVEKFCMVEPYFGNVKWLRMQMDYSEKKFFLTGGKVATPDTQGEILDLDDPLHVGYGNEWKGFTTGEVYVQVEMTGKGSQTGCIVQEIAGEKLYGEVTSKKAPGAQFADEQNGKLPTGEKGRFYPYPKVSYTVDVIEGKQYDPDFQIVALERELVPHLKYKNMPLDGQDGFTPSEVGTYRITYQVKDTQGNIGRYYRFFDVVESLGEKGVRFDYTLPQNFKVGTWFSVPTLVKSGLSHLMKCEESIVYNGAEYLDMAGERVFLNAAGEIKIKGSYKDYFGETYEFEKTYAVTANDETITEMKGVVPKYVLKNRTIVLPNMTAINYSKSSASADYNTKWTLFVDGTSIDTNSREFKTDKAHGEQIQVEYKVGETTIHTAKMTVVDAKYLSDRFYVTSGSVQKADTLGGVTFTVNADAVVDYINPVLLSTATSLPISLKVEEGKTQFEYVDVYYQDYVNPDICVFVRLMQGKDGLVAQVNGEGEKLALNTSKSYGVPEIVFNVETNAFDFATSKKVLKDVNGNEFNGFPSKRVNVSMEFRGVTGESTLCIAELGAYGMLATFEDGKLKTFEDKAIPAIVSEKTYRDNTWKYGDKVTMYGIEARTALSGLTTAKITVTSPSGKKVLNNVNAYNDYEFTITEYGTYQIQYTVPFRSTLYKLSYSARVYKEELPEITIADGIAETYTQGASITIPKVTIANGGAKQKIEIYVIKPDLTMHLVSAGDSFTLDQIGAYRISVTFTDEYNIVFKSVKFKAEVGQ